jgi:hypothetical protein
VIGLFSLQTYLDFAAHAAVDVVAIGVLAFAIYLPRHQRWDLATAFVALNLGLLVVLTALLSMTSSTTAGLAVGFGLFAVLSIVRLRSEASSFTDVAYFFCALALGLLNGAGLPDLLFTGALNVLLVAGMWALESLGRGAGVERQTVVLDAVFASRRELRDALAARLGGEVLGVRVVAVDYVRDVTRVEVELRLPPDEPALEEAAREPAAAPRAATAPAYATLLERPPEPGPPRR